MRWAEAMHPARMVRVALVAPHDAFRAALVTVADSGKVELEHVYAERPHSTGLPVPSPDSGEAARRLQRLGATAVEPRLAHDLPDLDVLERDGRADLLAGEAQLEDYASSAARRDSLAGLVGWCPADDMTELAAHLATVDAALVALPNPPGTDPPTLLRAEGTVRRSFAPLVRTYGTVPYVDVDPTVLAGVAYAVMFGMMFADVGHGALLMIAAIVLRAGWPRRLAKLRPLWPFIGGAGLASALFGVLFGEFFGPTGVVPVVWLAPLDEPVRLLAAGIGVGAVLLAVAYVVGTVNRWREGGARLALYAPSGIAGASLFAGLGSLAAGIYLDQPAVAVAGGTVAVIGLVLAATGLYVAAGGGGTGVTQAVVQLFDLVIRIGANLVSFARLAAFGLTHAALGGLVWVAVAALWSDGGLSLAGAVVVFAVGNAVTFGLEALVSGVQALRLEYYELFSRVFEIEGRPFHPWHVPEEEHP